MAKEPGVQTPAESFQAAFVSGTVWGQMSRGGKFHAFRQAWWDDETWVPECNRHAEYGDLQLHSLDSRPGPGVCGQAGCAMALHALRRAEGR